MTTLSIERGSGPLPLTNPESRVRAVVNWISDVMALTRRNLIHVVREPAQLSDATIQPVLFTLLFIELFGGAMQLPGDVSYKAFAIGGLIAMNLTTGAQGTAVGLSSDVSTGVIDRLRTLPIARSAILTSRTLSDLLSGVLATTFVVLTGLAIGWRPPNGVPGVLAAIAVAVVFSYALSWFCACIGLAVRDPESAQGIAMIVLFPLALVSSSFVPVQSLSPWLGHIAEWNPVSAVAGACRNLMGDPNPAGALGSFPAQHPVAMVLISSAILVAICAPLATWLLRRRTAD